MNFKAFRYISMIWQTENITHAAEKLYISQSALTQYVNSLEKKLKQELLLRTRNHCSPTLFGQQYIEIARACLCIENELNLEFDNLLRMNSQRMRIALSRQTGSLIFSRIMPIFLKEYPEVQVEIIEADTDKARELLLEGKVDLAILLVPDLKSGLLKYQKLYKEELKVIMPLAYKSKYPSQVELQALKEERFIMQQQYTAFQHIGDHVLAKRKIEPKVACRINLFRAIANLVEAGAGISFFPGHMINDYAQNCYSVSLSPPEYYYFVYAIQSQGKYGQHFLRFMELLENSL